VTYVTVVSQQTDTPRIQAGTQYRHVSFPRCGRHLLHLRCMSGRSLVLPTFTRWQDTLAMNTKCHWAAPDPTRSYPSFLDFSHGANTYFGSRTFASRRPIYPLLLRLQITVVTASHPPQVKTQLFKGARVFYHLRTKRSPPFYLKAQVVPSS